MTFLLELLPTFLSLLFLILIGYIFHWFEKKSRKLTQILNETGNKLGLRVRTGGLFSSSLHGEIEGFAISVKKISVRIDKKYKLLRIYISYTLPYESFINISKAALSIEPVPLWKYTGIPTGDNGFDKLMRISSSKLHHVMAILDSNTRKKIIEIASQVKDMTITSSWFSVYIYPPEDKQAAELIKIIGSMLKIIKRISRHYDIPACLKKNILTDPEPGARSCNIRAYITGCPLDKDRETTLQSALKDENVTVQIEGARHMGEPGMAHLCGILEREDLHYDYAINIIRILGENRYRKSLEQLLNIFEQWKGVKLNIEILKTLQVMEDESASSFLVKLLCRHSEDANLLLETIRALAACGKAPALKELGLITSGSREPLIRTEAQKAINSIQKRLGQRGDGWLTMAELTDAEGGLSISGDAGEGGLSVADDDFNNEKKTDL